MYVCAVFEDTGGDLRQEDKQQSRVWIDVDCNMQQAEDTPQRLSTTFHVASKLLEARGEEEEEAVVSDP